MTALEQIRTDVTTAMKAGDRERAQTLRMLVAALQLAEKEDGGDEVAVLRRERKRRVEAAEQYDKAGRDDLASTERAEAELVTGYLPAELDDATLAGLVDEAIAESGASEMKDMGNVMTLVMAKAQGQADGKRVSSLVKERLGA